MSQYDQYSDYTRCPQPEYKWGDPGIELGDGLKLQIYVDYSDRDKCKYKVDVIGSCFFKDPKVRLNLTLEDYRKMTDGGNIVPKNFPYICNYKCTRGTFPFVYIRPSIECKVKTQ